MQTGAHRRLCCVGVRSGELGGRVLQSGGLITIDIAKEGHPCRWRAHRRDGSTRSRGGGGGWPHGSGPGGWAESITGFITCLTRACIVYGALALVGVGPYGRARKFGVKMFEKKSVWRGQLNQSGLCCINGGWSFSAAGGVVCERGKKSYQIVRRGEPHGTQRYISLEKLIFRKSSRVHP